MNDKILAALLVGIFLLLGVANLYFQAVYPRRIDWRRHD